MKKVLFALLLLVGVSLQAQEISIIPKPAEMQIEEGEFLFNGEVVLCYPEIKDGGVDAVVDKFVEDIKKTTGVKLVKDRLKDGLFLGWDVQEAAKKGDAHIVLYVDEYMGKEAYRLSVTPKRINIAAATPAGFFYALQTLKQLMPRNVMAGVRDESIKEWSIACVFIVDEPRFSWRGFMLDEGRHFYGK